MHVGTVKDNRARNGDPLHFLCGFFSFKHLPFSTSKNFTRNVQVNRRSGREAVQGTQNCEGIVLEDEQVVFLESSKGAPLAVVEKSARKDPSPLYSTRRSLWALDDSFHSE